jgi:hypothetical protein
MKELIFFILAVLVLIWGLYRCFKTKNERLFYALLLFASLILHGYPLHWPIELSLSIWGFLGFFVMGYKILYKKLDKSLIAFAIVLLTFGVIFLLHGIWCPW